MSSRACGRRHGGRRISGTARRRPAKRSASADTPAADTAATPSPAEYSSPACYLHELESLEAAAGEVRIKRIYDSAEAADGYRALVDRLWPRGISRRRAALDAWLVELAPSRKLRLWFGHDPKRWSEFRRRYRAELRSQRDVLDALRERARRQRVTLLYGSREPRINHAAVLREVLLKPPSSGRQSPRAGTAGTGTAEAREPNLRLR
ncbi:MAG TPA: DUF488 family protein [Steroidobacteraceae bacterium]|nr:DUF488 family protein [Steroidobacteraceae bacterium]